MLVTSLLNHYVCFSDQSPERLRPRRSRLSVPLTYYPFASVILAGGLTEASTLTDGA